MSRASISIAILALGTAFAAPGAVGAPLPGPVGADEFARFVEERLLAPLRQRRIGGMVLVAVRDGRELHRVARGYRNVEERLPVDVDRTMFVIASVSKTFTATAIAQLESRGMLGYDDLVARRLTSVRLGSRYAGQLKIRNLLTHTTGIPDLFLGASCRSSRDCLPLARFLQERQPEAQAPPGLFVSYSNLSNALAGQVVEDVSGQPYGDYLREHVLRPLGMRDARYDVPGEPAADDAAANRALGYELDGSGRLVRSPSNYSMFYPAGQVAASGADMGRYMIAHLEGGAFLADDARLDMQRIHAHTPGFRDGYGWGWNVRHIGDVAVIGHGGDLRGVVSDLVLVPEAHFGYFVAITGDAGPVLEDFSKAFRQRYLASPSPPPAAPVRLAEGNPPGMAGVYQDFRFAHHDPLQLLSVLSETRIRETDSSSISVDLPLVLGGGTYRLLASGKDEFRVSAAPGGRSPTPGAKLRVLRDGQGAIRYFAFEDRGYDLTAEKLPAWRQTRFKLPGLAGLLLAFLVASFISARGLTRRVRRGEAHSADRIALGALGTAALAAAVFPLWVGVALAGASRWDLLYGLASLGLKPAYALLPGAAVLLVVAAISWKSARGWPTALRGTYAAAVLAGAAYLLLLAANGQFARVY